MRERGCWSSGSSRRFQTGSSGRVGSVLWPSLLFLLLLMLMGAACLPRQLELLAQALGPTGDVDVDARYTAMRSGLTRMMVADRLVPSPIVMMAGIFLVVIGQPVLQAPRSERGVLWAVAAVGLAPLVIEQGGELAVTWLSRAGPNPTPGFALNLPHRFESGIFLLWRSDTAPPLWLEVIDARVNLITLGSVALWTAGLHKLAGTPFRVWQLAVPLASLGLAGAVTWLCGPTVLSLVLGSP